MNANALLAHVALFLLLAAGIAVVLSAYREEDLGRILRTSVRRLGVFVLGSGGLFVAMFLLERLVLDRA